MINCQLIKQFDIHIDCFRISIRPIYSSAAWERAEFPGPIFTEGKCMRAWSLKVGEPKGSFPIMTARRTNGCCKSVRVELRRKLRAFISQPSLRLDQFEQLFVGIEFVCPDIDGKFAAVRNDIVLCTGMDNRYAHFHPVRGNHFFPGIDRC